MEGKVSKAMIIGKGSLFLGRLTNQFDGVSFLLQKNAGASGSGSGSSGHGGNGNGSSGNGGSGSGNGSSGSGSGGSGDSSGFSREAVRGMIAEALEGLAKALLGKEC
jgi:hypothetical protein